MDSCVSNSRILTGQELINRGATKQSTTLPEAGTKDVLPNGSWLEQKQIQAALETRKNLLDVQRIEKHGSLTHAEWNEELQVAKVIKQSGGYWQFLGHTRDQQLYLNPEEALFLLEVNSLRLTYNEVVVSLQQAYTLLLKEPVTILQYKVYASLSRLGYKIFRHEKEPDQAADFQQNNENRCNQSEASENSMDEGHSGENLEQVDGSVASCSNASDCQNPENSANEVDMNIQTKESNDAPKSNSPSPKTARRDKIIRKITSRSLAPPDTDSLNKAFEAIPDMINSQEVKLTIPDQSLLPRNVFPNHNEYQLRIQNLRNKTITTSSNYSLPDDVNDSNVGRIRCIAESAENNIATVPQVRVQYQHPPLHFIPLWRFQNNFNIHQTYIRHIFQQNRAMINERLRYIRETFPLHLFGRPRVQSLNGTMPPHVLRANKEEHLAELIAIAAKLKAAVQRGVNQSVNIFALHNQINSYNIRYDAHIELNRNLEIVENLDNVIELDADEAPPAKRPRITKTKYYENLRDIKELAQSIKQLAEKHRVNSTHRRALSNLIKKFNSAYNVELYLENYEIVDPREIVIESSDSDCVVEEPAEKPRKKKLRNPFNVLKMRAEQASLNESLPSTSTADKELSSYRDEILKTVPSHWLPSCNDFGRAEVLTSEEAIDTTNDKLLFEFLRDYKLDWKNWREIKIYFWENMEDRNELCSSTDLSDTIDSLVKADDCKDYNVMLDKLRIIPNCNSVLGDTDLKIDFDCYKKEIRNFRKSHKPRPRFRIVCLAEKSSIPSGEAIATLISQCKDKVPLVFAIVGDGSISYLRIKPVKVPIYLDSDKDL